MGRVEFSPNGNYLLACFTKRLDSTGYARLWRLADKDFPSTELSEHESEITTTAFSPDERLLLSGGIDDNVRLWSIANGNISKSQLLLRQSATNTHTADITRVIFSPDGKRALTAAKDQTAILWELAGGVDNINSIAVLHHKAM